MIRHHFVRNTSLKSRIDQQQHFTLPQFSNHARLANLPISHKQFVSNRLRIFRVFFQISPPSKNYNHKSLERNLNLQSKTKKKKNNFPHSTDGDLSTKSSGIQGFKPDRRLVSRIMERIGFSWSQQRILFFCCCFCSPTKLPPLLSKTDFNFKSPSWVSLEHCGCVWVWLT